MKKYLIKKFIIILVLLLFPTLSQSQSIEESECLPFASSQWVLQNTKTGEIGQVTESYFNPPGTCQFKVEYPDGSWDWKIVLSKSERERIRNEMISKSNSQREEVIE